MSVAAVELYGHAFWVCPLAGECPCRRGRSSPGYVRRVAWGYRVKPGEEAWLLVSGGGGSGGVIVGGDEVQQGPWSVEACPAAVPARAWYALVIVSDWWHAVSGALCSGMNQGAWCSWTLRVACLWPLGASSRMVGAVQPSADGVGSSCLVQLSMGCW